ncbi:hypothetical protein R6Z07M_015744 [Ovis aries]
MVGSGSGSSRAKVTYGRWRHHVALPQTRQGRMPLRRQMGGATKWEERPEQHSLAYSPYLLIDLERLQCLNESCKGSGLLALKPQEEQTDGFKHRSGSSSRERNAEQLWGTFPREERRVWPPSLRGQATGFSRGSGPQLRRSGSGPGSEIRGSGVGGSREEDSRPARSLWAGGPPPLRLRDAEPEKEPIQSAGEFPEIRERAIFANPFPPEPPCGLGVAGVEDLHVSVTKVWNRGPSHPLAC